MTVDVRIRRLNVRVRARGAPWATRDELARAGERARSEVLAGLERILATALSGVADDAQLGTLELEVAAKPRGVDGRFGTAQPALAAQLDAALTRAVRDAAQRHLEERALAQHRFLDVESDASEEKQVFVAVHERPAEALLALLVDWHAQGRLGALLELLAPGTVRSWLEACLAVVAQGGAGASTTGSLETDWTTPTQARTDLTARAALLAAHEPPARMLLELVTDLAAASPEQGARATDLLTDAHANAPAGVAAPFEAAAADGQTRRPTQVDHSGVKIVAAPPAPITLRKVVVQPRLSSAREPLRLPERAALETALPFLLLGPLARTNWLATAASLLATREAAPHAHALGFSLAMKAMPWPSSGPLSPGLELAAAYAAGLPEPPAARVLVDAEGALLTLFSALDAMVADTLLRGHDSRHSLILLPSPYGLVLMEPEGLFPLAIAATLLELAPVIRAARVCLQIAEVSEPVLASELDALGLAYQSCALDVEHLLRGLGSQRAPAVEVALSRLDRTATLAAALALGETAWRLFAHAPAAWAEPDPCLALERFFDLSATMIVTRAELEIRLPLGPRSRDLNAAGLLADVSDVPWLGGRRLRFGIG